MGLRRSLVAVVAAIVAVLALDRFLTRAAGRLPPAVAGRTTVVRVDGARVNTVTLGEADAPDLVLVHSPHLGASAREFAGFARALADDYRVTLVDLPGFGLSERPRARYDIDRLADAIAGVVEARTDAPTVVASGHAFPAALVACKRSSARRLVAIGPRTQRRHPSALLSAVLDLPVVGTAAYLALAARPVLATHLAARLEVPAGSIPADDLAYAWRSAHQPGSRAAVSAWFGGDLDAMASLAGVAGEAAVDLAFVVGDRAAWPTLEAVRAAAEAAQAPVSVVSPAGAAPHVTAPGTLAAHLHAEGLLAA